MLKDGSMKLGRLLVNEEIVKIGGSLMNWFHRMKIGKMMNDKVLKFNKPVMNSQSLKISEQLMNWPSAEKIGSPMMN